MLGGWLAFAVAMLTLSGVLSALWGLLTLLRRGVFVATVKDNPLNLDYRAWGWIHIAVGVLAVVLAALLPRAAAGVRALTVGLAGLSIVANLLVITERPVWFAVVITLDIMVIFAVTAHGSDVHPGPRG